jgi:hypothetical protein
LKHDSASSFGLFATKWKRKGTFHHLIALFCTVSAKATLVSTLTTIFSNEIKDLEAILEAGEPQNR